MDREQITGSAGMRVNCLRTKKGEKMNMKRFDKYVADSKKRAFFMRIYGYTIIFILACLSTFYFTIGYFGWSLFTVMLLIINIYTLEKMKQSHRNMLEKYKTVKEIEQLKETIKRKGDNK